MASRRQVDSFTIKHQDIYHGVNTTWKEKQAQRKLLLRNRRIQNWCFAIEWAIIIGILWLVLPTVIERTF